MRLLNTTSYNLQFFEFSKAPDYVILSHRWGADEVTFQNVVVDGLLKDQKPSPGTKAGISKVLGACGQAIRDGYEWIWIDSCCIDRTSSAELSESINSMWNYYAGANVCYAYLTDIDKAKKSRFHKSAWWSRGWTLQELLAPDCVEFYNKNWKLIGSKADMYEKISEITHISQDALTKSRPFDRYSAAEKLSWAAHRAVTREEDEAYALLGLFQVNMPLLYGEGRGRAFCRLQEAIYSLSNDGSLFLFRYSFYINNQPLLADCPTRFCQRSNCNECSSRASLCFPVDIPYAKVIPRDSPWQREAREYIQTTVTSTRNEVSASLKLLDFKEMRNELDLLGKEPANVEYVSHIAVLDHTLQDCNDMALCLLLQKAGRAQYKRFQCCPALLRRVRDHEHKLHAQKVLIHPDSQPRNPGNEIVNVEFTLKGIGLCAVKTWEGRSVWPDKGRGLHYKVQALRRYESSRSIVEVSSLISIDKAFPTVKIVLREAFESWSIREVSQLSQSCPDEILGDSYISEKFSNHGKIRLMSGKKLTVNLRRMAACRRPQSRGDLCSFRYQIALEVT